MPYRTSDALSKTARFHVRATDGQARLIRAGAERKGLRLTDYIIDSLCAQAEMDLADHSNFVLPPEKWKAFLKELDRPPRIPAGLRRLFARAPVAESR